MNKIFQLFLALFFFANAFAQKTIDYTGVWNGKFYDNTSFGMVEDQYRFEVQIAQTGTGLEGVTYSYLNTTFYGKATHNGYIKTAGNKIVINEIKLVEVRSMGGGACLMLCTMKYSKVGADEFLEGTFTASDSKNGTPCDGGYVKLKKVQKSIFGIEKSVQKKITEIATKKSNTYKPIAKTIPKPVTKPTVKNTPNTVTKPIAKVAPKPVTKPIAKTTTAIKKDNPEIVALRKKAIEDSLKLIAINKAKATQIEVKPIPPTPAILKERENVVVQTINVTDTLKHTIKFYDYGEVDGDIVTIYVNNVILVNKKMLDVQPIEIPITLNESTPEVTITMVAENMGTIPPNTALMIVNIDGKRYEAKIESTEQKNATVKFLYKKK
jgi:hypothetical protein